MKACFQAVLIGALVVMPACAPSDAGISSAVKAKLIADVDSVKPGKPFNLAIHFKIKSRSPARRWRRHTHCCGAGYHPRQASQNQSNSNFVVGALSR